MKLTSKNYFTPANDYLTSSKIKDYLRDPYYFFQKHVLRTIVEEPTDAMVIGAGLDCYVMYGKKKFNKLYRPVAKRSSEPVKGYTELTQGQYQKIVGMATRVMGTTAYGTLDGFDRQVILSKDSPWKIAGCLDFLSIDKEGGRAIIVDLKSSATIDPKKYIWHAEDMNWTLQAAMYCKLVLANYPNVHEVEFYHITVEKDPMDLYHVQTFKFDWSLIRAKMEVLNDLIAEIYGKLATKDFKPQDTAFTQAILLGANSDWKEV